MGGAREFSVNLNLIPRIRMNSGCDMHLRRCCMCAYHLHSNECDDNENNTLLHKEINGLSQNRTAFHSHQHLFVNLQSLTRNKLCEDEVYIFSRPELHCSCPKVKIIRTAESIVTNRILLHYNF